MTVFRNISVVIDGTAAPLVSAYAEAASASQAFAREQAAAADASAALNRSLSGLATKIREVSAASAASSTNTARWSESSAAARANVDRLAAASTEAAGSVRSYTAEAGLAASETAALRTSATQAANRVLDLGAAGELAAPEMAALGAAADAAAAGTAALGAGSQAAAAGAARVATSAGAAAAGAGEMGAAATAGAAGVGALSRTTSDAERIAGRLGGSLGLAGAQAGTLAAQVSSAASSASRAGAAMELAGKIGAAGLAIGLIASAAAAVKFDAEMHNVASIDASVGANFAATEAQILSLSRVLPQSAQTLAEGLYNIASSGFYGADAMQILGVSARAASAGLTTTDVASKAIVASLNAYGLQASSATRISDALFSTVNYGVISFAALTSAVANSVGNAAQAGVGIEQLGTALATMTLSGLSASNAGVSLNNLLAKMIKPSQALSDEFKKLGITQDDLSDSSTGLYGVMMKLKDSGDANLQTMLKWFPEIRAVRGALALMAGDGANYTRVMGEMGDATLTAGSTTAVFNEQAKAASFQLDLLKNKIVAAGISIGTAILPALTQGIGGFTDFLGAIGNVGQEILSKAEPGFRALGQAILNVIGIVRDLRLDDLAAAFARLGLAAVVAAFDALAIAIRATTGFLHDHESIVVAVGLAYGALRLEAVAAGFASLAVSARAAMAAMDARGATLLFNAVGQLASAMTLLSAVVPSVSAALLAARNEFALGSALSGTFAGALGALRVGFTGLTASAAGSVASMGLYGAAIIAVGIGLSQLGSAGDKARKAMSDLNSSIRPDDLDAYGAAIADLTEKQKKLNDSWQLKGNPLGDILFPNMTQSAHAYGQEVELLQAKQTALKDNSDELATQFDTTSENIRRLADAAGIDLTGSLDKAGESGRTVRQQMSDMVGSLSAAGVSSDDMAAAMTRLDTATTGADDAAKALVGTLDLLIGNGLAVTQTADTFTRAMNSLSQQLSTNTTGFDGNTTAAMANRDALEAAVSAAIEHARAVTQLTGSQEDGITAFNDSITALENLSGASASTRGEITQQIEAWNGLSGIVTQVGGTPPVQLQVSTSGASESAALLGQVQTEVDGIGGDRRMELSMTTTGLDLSLSQLEQLQGAITTLPADRRVELQVTGADLSMSQLGAVAGAINQLPADRRTELSVPGADVARDQAAALYGQLTQLPADRRTEISAPGATEATGLVAQFIATTGQMPPSKWTNISAPGATASTGEVQNFINTVAAMVAAKATNISAPGATGAKGEVDALRAAIDALHDKSVTVTETERHVIEYAYYSSSSPNSPGLTHYATGGEIRGPGTATSDSILARLSDREWVIQAASAARYGRAAMASINAGTATVIPGPTAGYALGGEVRPVSPPGFAGGGMVSAGGYGAAPISFSISMPIVVNGGATNEQTAAVVGAAVDRKFATLVSHIRAGVS